MLDVMSPDPDLEDTADDEPSFGSNVLGHYGGSTDDREGDFADYEESDPGEDSDPLEPSLCGTAIYNPTAGEMETDLEGGRRRLLHKSR